MSLGVSPACQAQGWAAPLHSQAATGPLRLPGSRGSTTPPWAQASQHSAWPCRHAPPRSRGRHAHANWQRGSAALLIVARHASTCPLGQRAASQPSSACGSFTIARARRHVSNAVASPCASASSMRSAAAWHGVSACKRQVSIAHGN